MLYSSRRKHEPPWVPGQESADALSLGQPEGSTDPSCQIQHWKVWSQLVSMSDTSLGSDILNPTHGQCLGERFQAEARPYFGRVQHPQHHSVNLLERLAGFVLVRAT